MKRILLMIGIVLGMGATNPTCQAPPPLAGVVDSVAWNYGSMAASAFPAYFQSLKTNYGVTMAMLNLFPAVMVAAPVKQNYPNVSQAGVDKAIAFLRAAKTAGLKVHIVLSINCATSDQTYLSNYHDALPISQLGPYWPDCGAGGSPAQFAAQAGQFYRNTVSAIETAAEQDGVLDTIAAWAPQGNTGLGSSETRVDYDPYVSDLTTLTREGWLRGGRAGLVTKRPVTSWVIFGLPLRNADGTYFGDSAAATHTFNNLMSIYRNAGVSGQTDYLEITYDSNATDLNAAVAATRALGLAPSKLILTDFKDLNPEAGLAAIRQLEPDMYWIWKYDNISNATIRDFIAQTQ